MTGPKQRKVIAMCLYLLKVVIITTVVVNILVVYSLYYKVGPLFSKSYIRKFFDATP